MGYLAVIRERKTAQAAAYLLHEAGGRMNIFRLAMLLTAANRLFSDCYGTPMFFVVGGAEPIDGYSWKRLIRLGFIVRLREPVEYLDDATCALSEADIGILTETWSAYRCSLTS